MIIKTQAMKRSSLLFIPLAILLLGRCGNKLSNTAGPPFKDVDVAFHDFEIDPSKGDTLKMENGTSIFIPVDAFADADGKPVTGKVSIKYREFHNAAEILASGISMNYDSAGSKMSFQTAGMFEINAFVNSSTPVNIASGKSITVNLASGVNDGDYKFYKYDKEKNNWEFKSGGVKPVENAERKDMLSQLDAMPHEPKMPEKYIDGTPVFDFDYDEAEHPELKSFEGVMWEYAGNASPQEPDINKEKWVFTYNWSGVTIENYKPEELLYKVNFTSKERSFSTVVKPVLKGKKYEDALADFQQKVDQFKEVKVKRENLQKQVEKQEEFVRSYELQGFGIYNHDRIYHADDAVMVNAEFELDKNAPVNIEDVAVYLICGKDRSVNTFYKDTWDKFGYLPADNNRLVVVFPDNRIATFENNEFEHLDPRALHRESKHVFHLHTKEQRISSMNDLQAALK